MTKKEREALQKAVRLLYDQEWEEGMRILLPMAGLRSTAFDAVDGATLVNLKDTIKLELPRR